MTDALHYTYRVTWSPEDSEYVGTVVELPSLSWLAADEREAFDGIRSLAAEVVADMAASGETPPQALADRDYSGKVLLRMTPARHRTMALLAAEQGVSMNRYINDVLTGA